MQTLKVNTPRILKTQLTLIILFSIFLYVTPVADDIRATPLIYLPTCNVTNLCPTIYEAVKIPDDDSGCYEWFEEKREGILDIEYIPTPMSTDRCHRMIYISSKIAKNKKEVYLIARNMDTNKVYRTRVRFGYIKTISIEKGSNCFKVGQNITMKVTAYDEERNKFSSLNGFTCDFQIIDSPKGIVKLTRSSDYKNKNVTKRQKLEQENNTFSDLVYVEGNKTGSVSFKIMFTNVKYEGVYPEFKDIFFRDTIMVIEEYILDPTRDKVLIRSSINFKIFLIKDSGMDPVPDENYKYYDFEVSDKRCGKMEGRRFIAYDKECKVNVTCNDNRLKDNQLTQLAEIEVVESKAILGAKIKVITKELYDRYPNLDCDTNATDKWDIVEGSYYCIKHFFYSKEDDEIVHYDEGLINFEHDTSDFNNLIEGTLKAQDGNTKIAFQARNFEGTTKQFKHYRSHVDLPKIGNNKLSKSMTIYPKIKIEKFEEPFFTLPYLGKGEGQILRLIITGGSGKFSLESDHPFHVRPVDDTTVIGGEIGTSKIKVTDKEVDYNIDEFFIKIEDVDYLSYFEEKKEVKNGNNFNVSVVATHGSKNPLNIFTNCSSLRIDDVNRHNANLFKRINLGPPSYFNNRYNNSISQNVINEKLRRLNVVENSPRGRYLDYSNFGICSTINYVGLNAGLAEIPFKAFIENKDGTKEIEGVNPARILLYNDIVFNPVIKDLFTKEIIKRGIENPDLTHNYIISKDSELELSYQGGIPEWPDAPYDHVNNLNVIYNPKRENENKIKLDVNDNDKKIKIQCFDEGFSLEYKLSIYNKNSENLLFPLETYTTFSIGCYPPEKLSIYFIDEIDKKREMFDVPQIRDILYSKNENSADILRVYGFDQSKRMILNLYDYRGYWRSKNIPETDTGVYYRELSEGEIIANRQIKKEYLGESKEFIQGVLSFNDHNKEIKLFYYLRNEMNNHSCKINIIGPPMFLPIDDRFYLRTTKEIPLEVTGGSGDVHYNIEEDEPGIAKLEKGPNSRKIKVIPNKTGHTKITVSDDLMQSSTKDLYLYDIKHIDLSPVNPMPVESAKTTNLKIIDNFDQEMDVNLVKLRPIVTGENQDGIKVTLNKDKVNINSKKSGHYYLYIDADDGRVKSNGIEIIVFDKLEFYPDKLIFYPGESFTLHSVGGPENCIKRYEIANDKIATLPSNEDPEITAKSIGKTNLIVRVYNKDQDGNPITEIDKQEIPIRVDIPDRIEFTDNRLYRTILKGSTIKLLALLKLGNNDFVYGIGKMEFYWEVSDPSVLELINFQNSQIDTCTVGCDDKEKNPTNFIGIFVKALKEGKSTIRVIGKFKYNEDIHTIISQDYTIEVKEDLIYNIPYLSRKNDLQNGIYYLPYNIKFKLQNNKKDNSILNYKVVNQISNKEQRILEISSSGIITTYSNNGFATIEVSNSTSMLSILSFYVTDFKSIFMDESYTLLNKKPNDNEKLNITIQHENGILFSNPNEGIELTTISSHPKIANANIEKSKISVNTMNKGSANLLLLNKKDKKLYDVSTVNSLENEVTVFVINLGGEILLLDKDENMRSMLESGAEWISENQNIVKIEDGKAKGMSEGVANIILRGNDGQIRQNYQVKVLKISIIDLDYTKIEYITPIKTNPHYQSEYKIPVIVYNKENIPYTNEHKYCSINHNVKLSCQTENPDLILVNKDDTDKNCVIIPIEKIESENKNTVRIKAKISPVSYKNEAEISHTLKYIPMINLHNELNKLRFKNTKRNELLKFDSINNIEAHSSDESKVKSRKNVGDRTIDIFVPNDVKESFENQTITIENSLTSQRHSISVDFSKENDVTLFGLSREVVTDFLTMIVLILIIIGFIYFITNKYNAINFAGQPGPAGM